MSGKFQAGNSKMGKRGAFINGVWHCDCEPRKPAERFQTKNGGKNHGRWFYTCQKPQHKRCGFFLWQDDAQTREQAAVLGNSATEPNAARKPQTPYNTRTQAEPMTPSSKTKPAYAKPETPGGRKRGDSQGTVDFDFDWNSSGDEDLAAIAGDATSSPSEPPKKATKASHFDTPRHHAHEDDVFKTPSTSSKLTGLMSPINTTSRQGETPGPPMTSQSLVNEVLELLKPANIPGAVEDQLVQLLNRHELRIQGIAKGRDITRLAVQSKERKIAELQARISGLEADRETSRTVIAHLKQDIATSPKRPRRPQQTLRSEV